ncbi:MAG: hypothetical protein JNJ63_07940 [Hyphomonadaceae bacterium]|nr:hypothetical protein [Hyphomonadaceae bacterium]
MFHIDQIFRIRQINFSTTGSARVGAPRFERQGWSRPGKRKSMTKQQFLRNIRQEGTPLGAAPFAASGYRSLFPQKKIGGEERRL